MRVLTRRLVERAHAAGQPVVAWVVDRPDEIRRYLEWGIDGIETNRPDLGVQVLREWAAGAGGARRGRDAAESRPVPGKASP